MADAGAFGWLRVAVEGLSMALINAMCMCSGAGELCVLSFGIAVKLKSPSKVTSYGRGSAPARAGWTSA